MSSELSGQKTELPGETGTGTDTGDPGRAIAGQNITMSRRELRALSDAGSGAAHGDTAGGAADTGSPARAEGTGTGGQDGRPAEAGSADLAGNRTETGSADGVTTADVSSEDEGQPEGGTAPDLVPEGTGADEGHGLAPAAEVTPGPDAPDAGDGGFLRRPGPDTSVVSGGGQEGAVGIQQPDGSSESFGRGAGRRDVDAGEPGEQSGDERSGPDSKSSADSSQATRQSEGNSGEKAADGRDGDSQAQQPKDQVHVQQPAPDAGTDHPGETAAGSAPDQQPDDPRWAAMEQRMDRMLAAFEGVQAKLDASEARNEALEAKLAAATARIGELEAKETQPEARAEVGRPAESDEQPELPGSPEIAEAGEHRKVLGLGDFAGDDEVQADLAAYDSRIVDRPDQEENREPDAPERSGFDEAGQSTLGLAGTFGLVNPVLSMAMGLDSARRTYNDMSPDGKYETNSMLDTYVTAVGGMPPETAALALATAVVLPTLHGRLQGFIDKYRRKD